jgi:hypothetical protein
MDSTIQVLGLLAAPAVRPARRRYFTPARPRRLPR